MTKFKCTAESVGYLEEIVEARNEDEAWDIFEDDLDNGSVDEIGVGSIENKQVELISDEEAEGLEDQRRYEKAQA